jgi:hypothetical protein
MPKPLAICIEHLNTRSEKSRYLRCVALPGRQPGLRLDKTGKVLWQRDDAPACEVCVSADDRLILYRQEGMAPVTLQRAGRSLKVPCGKPVVVIDQDQIRIGRRRMRIHIHGEAQAVSAPSALPVNPDTIHRLVQAATTAAVVGTMLMAGGCAAASPTVTLQTVEPIVVREEPPVVTTVIVTPSETPIPTIDERSIAELIQGEWSALQLEDMEGKLTWISGALTITGDSYAFKASGQSEGLHGALSLNFFIGHPTGKITIDYADGVAPDDAISNFAAGDVLATLVFHANSAASDDFLIRVGEFSSLEFDMPSSEGRNWWIRKN